MEFVLKLRTASIAPITAALLLSLTACGSSGSAGTASVETPDHSLTALEQSAQSVVRIIGDATECGRREKGSGFVIGKDLVITNAHVVAGIAEPEIDGLATPKPIKGTVIYFDPQTDTALVSVPGLDLPALTVGEQLEADAAVNVIGYPSGESQVTEAGSVVRTFKAGLFDIYNTKNSAREIYEVKADINPGNSGGPMVDDAGVVHGLVFAKAPSKNGIGYVLLPSAIDKVVKNGSGNVEAVTSKCIPE